MTGREFPRAFLWGSATSAHQVEGDNRNNDWWSWEQADPGREKSGKAIDHANRYPADLALLKELGHNAYRFSLEWSRLEPAPGQWSGQALDHYERVLDCVHANGMTPMVTLHHFTLPRWFAEQDGWLAPEAVERFCGYVERVAARLGDRMPLVATINEPQVLALMGYALGQFPPQERSWDRAEALNLRLLEAHQASVAVLRSSSPRSQVGLCLQLPVLDPVNADDPQDQQAVSRVRRLVLDQPLEHLRAASDPGDWLGVQYYTRYFVDGSSGTPALTGPPEGAVTSMMGWEHYPEGLGTSLRRAAGTGLPLYVTENGIATSDDAERVRYLRAHLDQVRTALGAGLDIRGWFHWSSFDNFEWSSGWGPTFGLVEVRHDDELRRVPRPSAHALAEVFRSGSLTALDDASAAAPFAPPEEPS